MANENYSIQDPSITLSKYAESESVDLTLLNGETEDAITQGQLVYISANNTVRAVTLGTQFPIGVASTSAAAAKTFAVQSVFVRDLKCIALGAPLTAGAFVKPDGTKDADGRPNVVAVAAGDYAQMIVLAGGASGAEVRIGVLRTPIRIPAA